jgi:hypothetical protein
MALIMKLFFTNHHWYPYFLGMVLPSGQKLTLGLLATIDLVPFCIYAPFPALLPFSKCMLEIMFCVGVQHRLRFCLHHLNCVKMEETGKRCRDQVRRVWSEGARVMLFLEKGSVRRFIVMMLQPVLLSPKFGAKS